MHARQGTDVGGRRQMRGAGALTLALILVSGCGGAANAPSSVPTQPPASAAATEAPASASEAPPVASEAPASPTAAASVAATAVALPAGSVQVPGSHVSLVPPPGWDAATQFAGFQAAASGSSISVTELPGPFAEITLGLTKEKLATKGITVTSREELTLAGQQALLLAGTQATASGTYGRWMLAVGTPTLTALVNGAWPEAAAEQQAIIEASMRSVVFDPAGSTGTSDGLSFDIDPAAPLVRAGTIATAVILNTSGKVPSADPREPTLIVSPSLGDAVVGDHETFARQRLDQLPSVADVTVTQTAPITIDGLEGVELTATATRTDDGSELGIYCVLLGTDRGYILMVGQATSKDAPTVIDSFRATAKTFRQRG